ncbi:MAG TPA: MurR/RpiR family transcriptional regulator [Atribacter sp.]|uniref:HTH-type transcriptional regulator MurR n=1 Tax=Candidatus Atribacter allofermentans TaxID=1852833 RepID=A0A1V5SXD2_9BACT|nr:MurR/RpiR family transcriptional regulator [Atribacter sp.]MDD3714256.1 MurR/RpiR family transcriptional regulator [Atribacterota bacterium]OQA58903.1 MAG: HTH-type transcriptional regulator MurR [Candidatus Atribacteria bacterium ADurb.Bin276]HHT10063.1 MurR/RpiR family transcriptional regulator [Candidatus Atribacteria bacterium]MDI9593774.1 MurR/RpiR family transcriptional regulator [Atribacterota bacterium]HQK82615.1 MurR/RpiR family transcriptional regulator [Atribacter sp.]
MAQNKPPLIIKIKSNYSSFTPSLKKVADYLFTHFEDFTHMTINEVAKQSGVSESTLTRFSQKINMKNFQALKIQLAHELGGVEEDKELIYGEIRFQDSMEAIIQKIFLAQEEVSKSTLQQIDKNIIEKTALKAVEARKICIFCSGKSTIAGMSLYGRLSRLNTNCNIYTDLPLMMIAAGHSGPEDLIIVVSNSGTNPSLIMATEKAKENKAVVTTITSYESSPLAKLADYCILTAACEESGFFGESTVSRIAQLLVTDILYATIVVKYGPPALQLLQRSAEVLHKMGQEK